MKLFTSLGLPNREGSFWQDDDAIRTTAISKMICLFIFLIFVYAKCRDKKTIASMEERDCLIGQFAFNLSTVPGWAGLWCKVQVYETQRITNSLPARWPYFTGLRAGPILQQSRNQYFTKTLQPEAM